MQIESRTPIPSAESLWTRLQPPVCLVFSIALLTVATGASSRMQEQQVASQARAENVQVVLRGGIVQVTYDLKGGDPKAIVTVRLEVSRDGGKTWDLLPKSVSGDLGESVTYGPGKQIVWEAAKDVETLDLEQFRFRILIEGGVVSTPPVRAKKGSKIWLIPVIAGGAAAGAVAAAAGGDGSQSQPAPSNRPPTAALSIVVEGGPGVTAIAALTTVSFSASGSDPDGDTLTHSWNFGDGSATSSGSNTSHVYNSAGTFTVTLTASDGRGGSTVATGTLAVRSMSGTWENTFQLTTRRLVITQTGSSLTGTYGIPDGPGTLTASFAPPRGIHITAQLGGTPPGIPIFTTTPSQISADVNSFTGLWGGGIFSPPVSLTFTRR